MTGLPARLRVCFERREFTALHDLYAEDAVLEVHVGAAHDVHVGRSAVVDRYAEDFASPAVLLRWAVREAPWGAVVEAAAVQGDSTTFRWVHVLGIEGGRIATDTVYCSGGTATPSTSAEADARPGGASTSELVRRAQPSSPTPALTPASSQADAVGTSRPAMR